MRTRAAQDRPLDSTRGSKSSAPSQGQGLPRFEQQCAAWHGPVAQTAVKNTRGNNAFWSHSPEFPRTVYAVACRCSCLT